MIFTGLMAIILAGVIIGVLWMKNRELKIENVTLQKKCDAIEERHAALLHSLSKDKTTQTQERETLWA